MSPKLDHRSVTPIVNALRSFLRGRQTIESLRFADTVVARSQPPPQVPGGPYHKTSKIYYYPRDGRREVQPPLEIMTGKQLATGYLNAILAIKELSLQIRGSCTESGNTEQSLLIGIMLFAYVSKV